MSFINPLPCTVALIPVGFGLVLVRRGIEPHIGGLALPGGYLDVGEEWEEGAAREIKEEVGLNIKPSDIKLHHLAIAHTTQNLLIFCTTRDVSEEELSESFKVNEETLEIVVAREPIELCFPTHTKALSAYLSNLKRCLYSIIA
jgi:ADP-ribose pyrophosphatase YjhB (NUDIX family)